MQGEVKNSWEKEGPQKEIWYAENGKLVAKKTFDSLIRPFFRSAR